ncbi:hypothetical protein N0V90_008438 [Kalmusia sp. IMI 367209]|nr:hypothetical protein N0V90_008438 [Kalmusia sp. IMI 367209]
MAAILLPWSAPHFVATKSEEDIARRLREDEILINDGKPCSWVAWHLSDYDSDQGRAIATHLAPIPDLSHSVKKIIYENILNKIRRQLKLSTTKGVDLERGKPQETLLASELSTALKVLSHLYDNAVFQRDTSAETIMLWLKQRIATPTPENPTPPADLGVTASANIPEAPPIPRKRLCYICRIYLTSPHPSQSSLCIPCGAFNLASSLLSTPPNLSLPPTFSALITGARINLGYHTALRLLRCGARVIVTTRYPRDGVARYLAESDSAGWKDRLKVIGADFRCAADAFSLVEETKRCLAAWSEDGDPKLHLLINNAAQTLTDSVKKEQHAVRREAVLAREMKDQKALIEGTYKSRVRGEALPLALESAGEDLEGDDIPGGTLKPHNVSTDAPTVELEPYYRSSWVQSLFDIPYEDVISAHAVNTFVPLILCRELLPLMGHPDSARSPDPCTKPQGYIINVSSREGIFEDRINSAMKQGKHVHTNMSKAALNMITETEAATAWQSRRVAMNTVDPGYMSAAPEYENAFDGVCPIGWEDGAGRVLWPIAVGEIEGMVVKGRFLKHYGAVEVDPGIGRG